MTGTNGTVEKISLDPSRWQGKSLSVMLKTSYNLHFKSLFDLTVFFFLVQVIRGPLRERKEEIKTPKIVPTPKPRKSFSEDNNNPFGNLTPKVERKKKYILLFYFHIKFNRRTLTLRKNYFLALRCS